MAETVTRIGGKEARMVRSGLLGKRARLSVGLVLVLSSGLALMYAFSVGKSVERSSTETSEVSVPTVLRSSTSDSKSDHSPVAGGAEKPSDPKTVPGAKTSAGKSAASTPALTGTARDEVYRRLVVGKWETERSGHRELTIRPDGTATMVVRLVGINAVLFGEKLTFWIKWTIQHGKLAFSTTGGEPASRIKVITVMYGTNRIQQIRSLTKDRLLLIDEEGDPDHDYRRIVRGHPN